MIDDMRRPAQRTSRAPLWPSAARRRIRRRSLDQVIEIVEESKLTPGEQKQAAKLRRLLNDSDLPEAD
jgi:hypothetical protein